MRKILFINLFLVLFCSAVAQNNKLQSTSLCESALGASPNQLTNVWGPKTNLWYDKDINTLVFVHTRGLDSTSIAYAYSTNGGATWLEDTMLYYAPSIMNSGKFPQGVIYNPAGNTNPANAYVACFGPTTDTAGWNAHYEGTAPIGSNTNQQTIYPFTVAPQTFIPQGGTIVKNTGTTWWSAEGRSGTDYNDTIVLAKGIFGGGNFNYTYTKIPVPICTNNNGRKMFRNQAVIFDDGGQLGYVVVIGNDWVCDTDPFDSAMGLIIFKTTDGGNTWSQMGSPYLSFVDGQLMNNGSQYSAATQLDLAMDQNSNLHIGLPIVPFTPGNIIYNAYPFGSWGLFDVSIHGPDFYYCLIAKPETFFGVFPGPPDIYEENRLQLSRSWDGDKLFYTWFDTDTSIFGAIGNLFPDMHCVGYDVTLDLWTAEVNFTEFSGTTADGNSQFGNVSYYTINDGTNENIPVVIDVMSLGTGEPVSFFYEGCTSMSNYVNTGNCVTSPIFPKVPIICTVPFSISSPYPNPFSQKTSLDITLTKTSDVTLEITNAIGQKFSTAVYKNLHSVKNTVSIDGSSLSKGLYFYTVRAGGDAKTGMMSVE